MLLKFRRLSILVASFAVPLWLSSPLAAHAACDAAAKSTEVQEACTCPFMGDFDEFYWGWYEDDTCPESLEQAVGEDRCSESVVVAECETADLATTEDTPALPVPQDADYWYDSETGDYHAYEFVDEHSSEECIAEPAVELTATTDAEGCPLAATSDEPDTEAVSEEDLEPWPASIPSYDDEYAFDCACHGDPVAAEIAEARCGVDDWDDCYQGYCDDWCDCDEVAELNDTQADEVVELTCDEPAFDGDAHRDAVYREYQWYYELEESFEQVPDIAEVRDDQPQSDAEATVTAEVVVETESQGDYLEEYEAYVNQDAEKHADETVYAYEVDGEFDEEAADAWSAYDEAYAMDGMSDYEEWYGYEDEYERYADEEVDQPGPSSEVSVETTPESDVTVAVEAEAVEAEAVEAEAVEAEAVEPEAAPQEMEQGRAALRTIARTLDRVGRSLQGLSQHLDRLASEQVAQAPASDAARQR